MANYCVNQVFPSPFFKEMGPGLAIIFEKEAGNCNFGKIEDETTQKTTQKILELIKENPKISRKEIASVIDNITEDGVKYHIDKFKKLGILKRIGADKGGYWEVNDKH